MEETQRNRDEFIAFLHRHIIPMVFIFERDGVTAPYVITTFVLSVQERWFLVTAGHCLQQVDEYKAEGYALKECYLMDSLGTGAKHFEPFPFTYDLAKPKYVGDDREFDFGIIPLMELHRGLLSANEIAPLSEAVWRIQPKDPEFFALVGIPTGNLKTAENKVGVATALNWIEECEKPDSLPDTEIPLFYGKTILHTEQKSLVGMSGGPIFAFKEVNGQYRYWLKALQSRWIEQTRIVVGCPTIHLGDSLDKMIADGLL